MAEKPPIQTHELPGSPGGMGHGIHGFEYLPQLMATLHACNRHMPSL